MITESFIAFRLFKGLTVTLCEWGYDVRDYGEYGEFSLAGFVCSYRFFDVLDIQFLSPGETLRHCEPDMLYAWKDGWCDLITAEELAQPISTLELFNECVLTINLMTARALGLAPDECLLAGFYPDQTGSIN